MPTTAPAFEPRPARLIASNGHAQNFAIDGIDPRADFLEPAPATHTVMARTAKTTPAAPIAAGPAHDLPGRIRRLIEIEGSAAAIARRCGFSAGTISNWRDGHSDISRERCIILARTLGISLSWLVAGEGPMYPDAKDATSPASPQPEPAPALVQTAPAGTRATTVDPKLFVATLKLLQSYVGLMGGSLDPLQRAEALAELYDIFAQAGEGNPIDRLIAFQATLRGRLRRNHPMIA